MTKWGSELEVLKAVIDFCCPWCHHQQEVRLGSGRHKCEGCGSEITDRQLVEALRGWVNLRS